MSIYFQFQNVISPPANHCFHFLFVVPLCECEYPRGVREPKFGNHCSRLTEQSDAPLQGCYRASLVLSDVHPYNKAQHRMFHQKVVAVRMVSAFVPALFRCTFSLNQTETGEMSSSKPLKGK